MACLGKAGFDASVWADYSADGGSDGDGCHSVWVEAWAATGCVGCLLETGLAAWANVWPELRAMYGPELAQCMGWSVDSLWVGTLGENSQNLPPGSDLSSTNLFITRSKTKPHQNLQILFEIEKPLTKSF